MRFTPHLEYSELLNQQNNAVNSSNLRFAPHKLKIFPIQLIVKSNSRLQWHLASFDRPIFTPSAAHLALQEHISARKLRAI